MQNEIYKLITLIKSSCLLILVTIEICYFNPPEEPSTGEAVLIHFSRDGTLKIKKKNVSLPMHGRYTGRETNAR